MSPSESAIREISRPSNKHSGPASKNADLTDPDVFVRLAVGSGLAYPDYTARHVVSHVFGFRVVVHQAIPQAGLILYVQDDDGTSHDESMENIGTVRISAQQLAEAVKGDGLKMKDKEGGLEHLGSLSVAVADPTRRAEAPLDVAQGLSGIDHFEVAAGEVVDLGVSGEYRNGMRVVGPDGVPGNVRGNISDHPFGEAPHGAALAVCSTASEPDTSRPWWVAAPVS